MEDSNRQKRKAKTTKCLHDLNKALTRLQSKRFYLLIDEDDSLHVGQKKTRSSHSKCVLLRRRREAQAGDTLLYGLL